jgi:hypothetical protein
LGVVEEQLISAFTTHELRTNREVRLKVRIGTAGNACRSRIHP